MADPWEAEIDRAQARLEQLFSLDWLMVGVRCLRCGRDWKDWPDREHDRCGCTGRCEG